MRVFAPLPADHPLVREENERCADCHEGFKAGDRITLQAVDLSSATATKRAIPMHARCALQHRETPLGIVESIEDGDGVLLPVKLTNGRRVTFRQIGVEANE